jgi:hypothetical protein
MVTVFDAERVTDESISHPSYVQTGEISRLKLIGGLDDSSMS